ncbi:MAG TPA: DUF4373 domain-containing protein [Bacteroidia bacterium]|nr:DUF4373 domain-containing protein [Bacteroidia bacterium]
MSNKKDSYWFRHDSTAGRALKMRKMAHRFGHWGKGIYWDVIEILRDQNEYKYESNDDSLRLLADLIGCKDVNKFILWFNECLKVELFKNQEDGCFYSEILSKNMMKWEQKKNNGSQPKNKRNGSETEAKQKDKIIEDKITKHITEHNSKEEGLNPTNYNDLEKEILNSGIWIEETAIQYKLEVPFVENKLREFLKDVKLRGDAEKGLKEVKKYFINWLKIQIKNGKSIESGSTAIITPGKSWKS